MARIRALLVFVSAVSAALAQPAITDVVNAASRIPGGFPSWGVAQGALFAITGKSLGPEELQQASFPLPTTDGLAGVTVKVTIGGTSVDAILVYVSANEIGAILPSKTPTGNGTVTVNSNGAVVTAPIRVLSSAFGIFTLAYYAVPYQATAFNLGDDGRTLNYADSLAAVNNLPTSFRSAKPGQTVEVHGTGLGAISGDETQSVGGEVPNTQIKVFLGTKEATVLSAGRGEWPGLPEGIPPFPIPQTIAAWDVIRFVVPDGILGCQVSIAVQTGNYVSNLSWIAVSADGGPCSDPNTVAPGETVTLDGNIKIANVNMTRNVNRDTRNGVTTEIGVETGTANFFQFELSTPVTAFVSTYGYLAYNLDPGSCEVLLYRNVAPAASGTTPSPQPDRNKLITLDAGDTINLKGPTGALKQLKKNRDGTYGGSLGSSFALPGLPANNELFLNPGTFNADNGKGGDGVPAFAGSVTQPRPVLTFDNIDQIGASVDRSKGVTVKWSGGDPNGFVTIIGNSINSAGPVSVIGIFACTERISAGQFTAPPFVTLNLPVTASAGQQPAIGVLSLWTYVANKVQIPTVDVALFSIITDLQRGTLYQ